ncbi:GTP-binding protein HflX [Streptococcus pneumoniae]|nr:GTP-binding protein HflX [Streptococcus pneumoniae]
MESSTFKIGLIGYTNAGKSTIMNILTSKTQYEADELFATLDATTKSIHLGGNLQVTLTDTVGFIQDLPTEVQFQVNLGRKQACGPSGSCYRC